MAQNSNHPTIDKPSPISEPQSASEAEQTCSMPQDDEREFDEESDCYLSYYAAVAEMRRRFLAGEPLPEGWRPEGYTE